MKKLFIAVSLIASSFAAFAQKPVAGDKGFTFGVNGLGAFGLSGTNQTGAGNGMSPTMLFRYYLADDMAVRAGLNYQRAGNTKTTDLTATAGTKTETKTGGNGQFAITLGIQKSLGSAEKLEPYVGADLLFGVGKVNGTLETTTTVTDATKAGGTNGDYTKTTNTLASQTRIGILPAVGFNYYFSDKFAFGAEFNWGFVYNNQGTGSSKTETKVGSNTTTTTTTGGTSTKAGTFGNYGSGLITVSVFF
jgi:hypothetical protein